MAVTLPVPMLNPNKKIPGRKVSSNFFSREKAITIYFRAQEKIGNFLGIGNSEFLEFPVLFSYNERLCTPLTSKL